MNTHFKDFTISAIKNKKKEEKNKMQNSCTFGL